MRVPVLSIAATPPRRFGYPAHHRSIASLLFEVRPWYRMSAVIAAAWRDTALKTDHKQRRAPDEVKSLDGRRLGEGTLPHTRQPYQLGARQDDRDGGPARIRGRPSARRCEMTPDSSPAERTWLPLDIVLAKEVFSRQCSGVALGCR